LQVKVNQSFNRLDKFIFQYFENIPLSLIQRLIRQYKIKINNKKSKANSKLVSGDIIYIYYTFEFQDKKDLTIKISEDFQKKIEKKINFSKC
jgi:23S rRNA-/tRNA-specific pseudouridylate synthase